MRQVAWLIGLVLICLGVTPAQAKSNRIEAIDVAVVLQRDGTAWATETWRADVQWGTEVYLVKDNLTENQMEVSGLSVRDDSGRLYQTLPEWNPKASFAEKAYRAGYLRDGNRLELCFGISQYGQRSYTIQYQMTNFAVRYADGVDGFNVRVVNDQISAPPERVSVTVSLDSASLESEQTLVWAFGFSGEIFVQDGAIAARSTEALETNSYVTILAALPAGLMSPRFTSPDTFDAMLELALVDSDYVKTSGVRGVAIIGGILAMLSLVTWLIWKLYSKIGYSSGAGLNRAFKRLTKRHQPDYVREPPGDLLATQYVISKKVMNVSPSGLIGAYLLKWLLEKRVQIEAVDRKDQQVRVILPDAGEPSDPQEAELWAILRQAAGQDRRLGQNELRKWADNNVKTLRKWFEGAKKVGKSRLAVSLPEALTAVLGFRRFLSDFTIINEREPIEVALWGDYLVMANLLGVADRVAKAFEHLIPGFLAETITAGLSLNAIEDFFDIGDGADLDWGEMLTDSRSEGGGGASSSFGGGEFSGGGSGGGFR